MSAAWGSGPDWQQAVGDCLDRLEDAPPGPVDPDLGFVFVTDHLAGDMDAILTILRGRTGINQWAGTTGIGIMGGRNLFFDTPAIAILTVAGLTGRFAFTSTYEPTAPDFRPWFGVLTADPRQPDVDRVIATLADREGGFWVGGLAASRGAHPVLAPKVAENTAGGVAFDDTVTVQSGLTQGCTPIGPVHEITRAERNILVELDGRPAFEVFRQEIGEVLMRNLGQVPGFIFAGLPPAGTDGGDYLVRDIVALDPRHGLVAIGEDAVVGGTVMFCRRDPNAARQDMARMTADLAARMNSTPPAGGLYFSCLGRGPGMFGDDRTEADMIADAFGDIPMVGVFGNGEVSNARLFTYTGVLSLFG